MASYVNPYTGATWNNSFSRMLDMTRTWNQNLWQAQQRVQQVAPRTAAVAHPAAPTVSQGTKSQSNDIGPHFPEGIGGHHSITATDIPASAEPVVPDELIDTNSLTPNGREELRATYEEWLRTYERMAENRPNNLANSLAYAAAMSLREIRGTAITIDELNRLIAHFNDALIESPEFPALTPQQKRIIYVHAVITGATIGNLQADAWEQKNFPLQEQARGLAHAVLAQLTISET
jgi:hypothetical protein